MGRTSTYPIEFRQQAASLVLAGGRSVRDVARELGINHEMGIPSATDTGLAGGTPRRAPWRTVSGPF